MRRILITGSRDWLARNTVWLALNEELERFRTLTVVHGGARGADEIAARWAWGCHTQGWNVTVEEHRADWETHGKRAGVLRNQLMVDLGADVCHAFPLNKSIGTRHCMARAEAAGIPVINHGWPPFTAQSKEFARAYG